MAHISHAAPAMTVAKLLPFCACLLLTACAGSSPPPASTPPTAASSGTDPQPGGATDAQGDTKQRSDLKSDLASVDAALADLNVRIGAARDAVKADLQVQLAALQKRDDELKAQLRATGASVDAEGEKMRRNIHKAIMDLKGDMQQLTDKIQR